MSRLQDALHESEEYQQIAGETGPSAEAKQATEPVSESVPEAVQPVAGLEKTDLEFWMQVASVFLLFLIWRELSRQNGAAVAQALANGGGA